jgi:hypothetical protein
MISFPGGYRLDSGPLKQLQAYLLQFNFSLLEFIFLVVYSIENADSIILDFVAKIKPQILIKQNHF